METGFQILHSQIPPAKLAEWWERLSRLISRDAGVAHYDVPMDIAEVIAEDPQVKEAVRQALPSGAVRVHSAFHNNPSGAQPLDWHRDNCEPWFHGPVEEAPPALRIWFFPQDVPLDRGPLELVPSDGERASSIVATCRAGDFLAVYDLALEHRQTRNVSGLDRFMIRLEFAEVPCQI